MDNNHVIVGNSLLLLGDSLQRLKELPENSIDAVVTDPPYGLSFMNKKWDYDVPSVELWREVLRVLKPGGHLLSFFGTRTYHRGVVRIEDAGFEIRDQIQWIYGSGFPKSYNLKDEWQGWGTALKPANEPIVLARKPLEKGLTVAENVLKWGTGAINVDGCRVGDFENKTPSGLQRFRQWSDSHTGQSRPEKPSTINQAQGRWPANVIFDEAAAEVLDEQSGGASRFFYCAKASKRERNAGLEGIPKKQKYSLDKRTGQSHDCFTQGEKNPCNPQANSHPTVKPIKLMEYLCKLVTPPNGVVLDPFMGSGTTGVAAKNLGFNFIGCELSPEYFEICHKRIANAKRIQTETEDETEESA